MMLGKGITTLMRDRTRSRSKSKSKRKYVDLLSNVHCPPQPGERTGESKLTTRSQLGLRKYSRQISVVPAGKSSFYEIDVKCF